jgi:hypothetical protein
MRTTAVGPKATVRVTSREAPVPDDIDADIDPNILDESYVAAQTRRMRAAADKEENESALRKLALGTAKKELILVSDVQKAIESIHRTWADKLELLPSEVIRGMGPVGMELKDKVRTLIEERVNKLREGIADGV